MQKTSKLFSNHFQFDDRALIEHTMHLAEETSTQCMRNDSMQVEDEDAKVTSTSKIFHEEPSKSSSSNMPLS